MIPQTAFIQDTNFNSAWVQALWHVLRDGRKMTIGDISEPKPIRDSAMLIELTGNAIKQITNREQHPQSPFVYIDQYCDQFTHEYQIKYNEHEEDDKFSYTYFDRMVQHFGTNQLHVMNLQLMCQKDDNISSNRSQMITWDPTEDIGHPSAPCLQSVWVRYIGDNQVEVHYHFRSRDGFTAWQPNVIALTDLLIREVIEPNGCKIVKILDYSDSFHIYESDVYAASVVQILPVFRGVG